MTTALVLSAGGLFGAYQAGVWAELSKDWAPDLVVGASIGALNGWMIAGGATGEQMLDQWRRPLAANGRLLTRDIAEHQIRHISDSWRPRVPLGVVCTEFPSMRQRLFRSPAITWRHLASSTAIPLYFRHQTIDGRIHSDGGLLTPLPLWAAVEMGATEIVAVNVLEHRPGWIRAIASLASRYARFRPDVPDLIKIRVISPSFPLGGLRESVEWSADRIERWIHQGRTDAIELNPTAGEAD